MAKFIKENNGKIAYFDDGERHNSIAAKANPKALFIKKLKKMPNFIKANFYEKKKSEFINLTMSF